MEPYLMNRSVLEVKEHLQRIDSLIMAHMAHHSDSAFLYMALDHVTDAELSRIDSMTQEQLDMEMVAMGLDPDVEVAKMKSVVEKIATQHRNKE
jgi:hypothetical protein